MSHGAVHPPARARICRPIDILTGRDFLRAQSSFPQDWTIIIVPGSQNRVVRTRSPWGPTFSVEPGSVTVRLCPHENRTRNACGVRLCLRGSIARRRLSWVSTPVSGFSWLVILARLERENTGGAEESSFQS